MGTINLEIVYGIVAVISLLSAIGYCGLTQKKETPLLLIHFAVFVVNTGYFGLAISKTLEEALLANRIAYLGSVFLPFFMFWAIMNVCQIKCYRIVMGMLLAISIVVFLLAASGGYLDVYYKETSLEFINGAAKLVKVYGPLHSVYLVYLLSYFGMMVGGIIYTMLKKKNVSSKLAVFLAVIVLGNVGIWFVEQLIPNDFEFLSVSYVLMEMLLALVYSMMNDEKSGIRSKEMQVQNTEMFTEEQATESIVSEQLTISEEIADQESTDVYEKDIEVKENRCCHWQKICPEVKLLTEREMEVFALIMENKKRKDIACELNVSENTVKKHTSHIFTKMCVTSRMELFEKMKV